MSLTVVEGVALTRPRVRVISSTKWELNITRKYHVASWAMAPRRVGPLIFDALDFPVKNMINENARKSGMYISPQGSVEMNAIIVASSGHYPDAPYNSRILVYAICRALCCSTIHRRYASRGIGGSRRPAHV